MPRYCELFRFFRLSFPPTPLALWPPLAKGWYGIGIEVSRQKLLFLSRKCYSFSILLGWVMCHITLCIETFLQRLKFLPGCKTVKDIYWLIPLLPNKVALLFISVRIKHVRGDILSRHPISSLLMRQEVHICKEPLEPGTPPYRERAGSPNIKTSLLYTNISWCSESSITVKCSISFGLFWSELVGSLVLDVACCLPMRVVHPANEGNLSESEFCCSLWLL